VLLAVPITLAMFVVVFQAALCWHARNIVEAASQEGSRQASAANGDCSAGVQRATSMVTQLGGAYVHAPIVTCRDGATVTIVVRADAFSLLPGLAFPVVAASVASAPKER